MKLERLSLYQFDPDVPIGYFTQYILSNTKMQTIIAIERSMAALRFAKEELKRSSTKDESRKILNSFINGGLVYVRRMQPHETEFALLINVIVGVVSKQSYYAKFSCPKDKYNRYGKWMWKWKESTYISYEPDRVTFKSDYERSGTEIKTPPTIMWSQNEKILHELTRDTVTIQEYKELALAQLENHEWKNNDIPRIL